MRRVLLLAVAVGCKASSHGAVDAPGSDTAIGDAPISDAPVAPLMCGGSPARIDMPDRIHGMFAYQPAMPHEDVPGFLLNNPVILGGNYLVDWGSVDKGNGVYDWSLPDGYITTWTAVGKKANLLFDADSFAPTASVPSYVVKPTGTVDTVDCYVAGPPKSGQNGVPLFWESGFVTAYKTFIEAAIERYDGNANVGYMRFGLSNGAQTGTTVCFDQLVGAGLTQTIWENYVADITSFEAARPHTTQLMFGLGPYGSPGNPNDGTNWTQDSFPDWEASMAVPAFGIGNQGLENSDILNSEPGRSCNGGDWCNNFAKYAGQTPLYLQQVNTSCVIGTPLCLTGLLTDIFPFAVCNHAQILEVYTSDLMTAYDTSDAATYNGEEATSYRAMFTQLAVTLNAP